MKFKAGAIGWLIPWAADSLNLWPCPRGPAAEHQEASILHPPTALYYSKFTLTLLTYHERQWEINSRLLSGKNKFEGRSKSPLLPHACMFCTSLYTGIAGVWLFPATHTPVAAVSNSVIGHRCCDIYPYLMMQSFPTHSVELLCVEFWKQRCFPVSLQEPRTFPLIPSACVTLLPLGMPVSIMHEAWSACR